MELLVILHTTNTKGSSLLVDNFVRNMNLNLQEGINNEPFWRNKNLRSCVTLH